MEGLTLGHIGEGWMLGHTEGQTQGHMEEWTLGHMEGQTLGHMGIAHIPSE